MSALDCIAVRRRAIVFSVLTALTAILTSIIVNVATGGTPPGPFARFRGLAWPAVGGLTILTVALAVATARGARDGEQDALLDEVAGSVRLWRRRRAAEVARRATAGTGYDGLADLHRAVAKLAPRRPGELIDALARISERAGRYDLAAGHDGQMEIYEHYRDGGDDRSSAYLVHEACLDAIQRYPVATILAGRIEGLRNLLPELCIGLYTAVRKVETAYLDPVGMDDASAESGRLTGLIEAFARQAGRASPVAARLVCEELLDPTEDVRRKVLARVNETLPDGSLDLRYDEITARAYREQAG